MEMNLNGIKKIEHKNLIFEISLNFLKPKNIHSTTSVQLKNKLNPNMRKKFLSKFIFK